MADNSADNFQNPLDFFRAKALEAGSEVSKSNLLRAVDALSKFVGGAEINYDSFDEKMMGEWIARLLFCGYTPKTISNNILKRLATLYNKAVDAGLAKPNDVFRFFQSRLTAADFPDGGNVSSDTFSKVQSIIRSDHRSLPRKQLAKDLLLFSLYMGGMSFDELAQFKKDGYDGSREEILEIVGRYSKPRNKYLFPLNQIKSTPKQLGRLLELMFSEILKGKGISLSAIPSDTSYDLWTALAMSCGVAASDVAACVPADRRRNIITALVAPSEISDKEIEELRARVASTLAHNPVRWYAMHLRRHTDYDMLAGRLKEKEITLEKIYYPMEEVMRKVGRRKVFESKPVISWLLFFRERVTKLNTLFNEIGDLAWGYRYTNDISSPYAVISDNEIAEYQATIGTLSPDTPILDDKDVDIREGDCLVILGGAMNGRHGVFLSQRQVADGTEGKRIVFRVKLGGGSNANWIVDWDPRLVRKISQAEYQSLEK